jgi:hypothetical protein
MVIDYRMVEYWFGWLTFQKLRGRKTLLGLCGGRSQKNPFCITFNNLRLTS